MHKVGLLKKKSYFQETVWGDKHGNIFLRDN